MKPTPTFNQTVQSGGLNDSPTNEPKQSQPKLHTTHDETPQMVSAHILWMIQWAYSQLNERGTTLNK